MGEHWGDGLIETVGTLDPVELREITGTSLVEQVYTLRVSAWRRFIHIPDSVRRWEDQEDAEARHWAFLAGDRPVAAARLSIHLHIDRVPDAEVYRNVVSELPAPIGSLNRCVVQSDFRGRELAPALDRVRISAARKSGCRSLIVAIDQPRRATTLESHGFRLAGTGEPYTVGVLKGVPNIVYVMHFDHPRNANFDRGRSAKIVP